MEHEILKAVYIGQYGSFWKFSPNQWLKFCEETLANKDGYSLPDSKLLKRRPRTIWYSPEEDELADQYFIVTPRNTLAEPGYALLWPLDWYEDYIWEEAIETIKERIMINKLIRAEKRNRLK